VCPIATFNNTTEDSQFCTPSECPEGTFADLPSAIGNLTIIHGCKACPAGTSSLGGIISICTECLVGFFAEARSSSCSALSCPEGQFSEKAMATTSTDGCVETDPSSNTLVGSIVGIIIFLLFLAGVFIIWYTYFRKIRSENSEESDSRRIKMKKNSS